MDYENREKWVETVRTAQDAGLDNTIPRRKAVTPAEIDLRDKTKVLLSRRSFLVPELPWLKSEVKHA